MRAAIGSSVDPRPCLRPTPSRRSIKTESSPPTAPEGINELLLDELRDILHAEKQLTKALAQNGEGGTIRPPTRML